MEAKQTRSKFVLYANPNNVTNRAYTARGAQDANAVLRSARTYPLSYWILFQGTGSAEDIARAQALFSYYRF